MYVEPYNKERVPITLGHLLNKKERVENVAPQNFLPEVLWKILISRGESDPQTSKIRNGKAEDSYDDCAKYLSKAADFQEIYDEIFDRWQALTFEANEKQPDGNYKKISSERCVEKIIDGDRRAFQEAAKLFNWLKKALKIYGREYDESLFKHILSALTLLAITRGHWKKFSDKLLICLPTLTELPGNPTSNQIEVFDFCKRNYEAYKCYGYEHCLRDVEKKFPEVFAEDKPLWNAYVCQKFSRLNLAGEEQHLYWLYSFWKPESIDATKKFLEAVDICIQTQFQSKIKRRFYEERLQPALEEFRSNPTIPTAKNFLAKAQTFFNKSILKIGENFCSDAEKIAAELPTEVTTVSTACFFLIQARDYLEDGLKTISEEKRRELLKSRWLEISEELLATLIKRGKLDAEPYHEILTREKNFIDKAIFPGKVYFRLTEFHRDRKEKFSDSLKRGVELENTESLDLLRKILDSSELVNLKWQESYEEILKRAESPEIRGRAYYRAYLSSKNSDDLRKAYRCGFPKEAVEEYNKKIFRYCDDLAAEKNSEEAGVYYQNVDEENPLAKIFCQTKPNNWALESDLENVGDKNFICLLLDDDAQKNLKDFLQILQTLKDKPRENPMIFFVRGSEVLATVVDSVLNRWYYEENRPPLYVKILDDAKESAEFLLAHHPLFFPIRKHKAGDRAVLNFVIAGTGEVARNLIREAVWMMTFPEEITTKITLLSPDAEKLLEELEADSPEIFLKLKPQVFVGDLEKFIEDAFKDGEKLYFAVAVAEDKDLKNLNYAMTLYTKLIRGWVKYLDTPTPPAIPVAYYCKDPDTAFVSKRSIVAGEKFGGQWFNTYSTLIPFGSRIRYSWKNLVCDIFSKMALSVHLVYCSINKNSEPADYRAAYLSYIRWTYNLQSSLAVALSIPYRLYALSRLEGEIFKDWDDITDVDSFFSAASLKKFSELLLKKFSSKSAQIETIFIWEHERWCQYVRANGWIAATIEEAKKYINAANNKRQQSYLGKLHPVLTDYKKLGDLAKELKDFIGEKNFKESNETSILQTAQILSGELLREESLQQLFFMTRGEA